MLTFQYCPYTKRFTLTLRNMYYTCKLLRPFCYWDRLIYELATTNLKATELMYMTYCFASHDQRRTGAAPCLDIRLPPASHLLSKREHLQKNTLTLCFNVLKKDIYNQTPERRLFNQKIERWNGFLGTKDGAVVRAIASH